MKLFIIEKEKDKIHQDWALW